jgi:hypothetical protein
MSICCVNGALPSAALRLAAITALGKKPSGSQELEYLDVSVVILKSRENDRCNGCAHWTIDVDGLLESTELGWLFWPDECVGVLDPAARFCILDVL